jgi:hypothetical protein
MLSDHLLQDLAWHFPAPATVVEPMRASDPCIVATLFLLFRVRARTPALAFGRKQRSDIGRSISGDDVTDLARRRASIDSERGEVGDSSGV